MSETISLLAAVRENPDERTVRLAAADHIRESDPERLRTAALLASSGPVYVTAGGKVRPRLTVADSGGTPGTYGGYINCSPCGGGWVHSEESAWAENQRCGYQTDLPGIHWPGAVEAGSVEAYTGDDVGDDSCYLDGLRDEDDADEYREWLATIIARESVRVCEAQVEAERVAALPDRLREAIDAEDDDAIRTICRDIRSAGLVIEIDASDNSPDDMGQAGVLWVVSGRTLTVAGETVAEWTRCGRGTYGEQGRQCSEDEWCVTEGTDGGDRLPDAVATALDALGLEDVCPDVPEPERATDTYDEDEDGEYAVYWETVGDDAHPVRRYATHEAAAAVADEMSRSIAARNPGGNLLCGYGVRRLDGGEWVRCDDE